MDQPLDISIIVPTYKEAGNIPELVRRITQAMAQHPAIFELLIMDDNSSDGIEDIVDFLNTDWLKLHVLKRSKRDLSSAVIEGLKTAQGKYLAVMDADLSHSPESIPEMIHELDNGAEFVLGSRYVGGGAVASNWGTDRWLNSRFAVWLARPFTRVADPMSGFFALKREVFNRAKNIKPCGYKIALELLVRCNVKSVKEVPIQFANRRWGNSKLGFTQRWQYIKQLANLAAHKITHRKQQ